jgi:hypothetical protein
VARVRKGSGCGPGGRGTAQLQTALNSRLALEQAKGIVAEQAGVDVDEAFGLLRGYARHHNRRLGEVVSDVIRRVLTSEDLLTRARGPASSRSDQ